jgi:hypothetical protein
VVFTFTGASGVWSKTLELYVHNPGEQGDTLLARYAYWYGATSSIKTTAEYLNNGQMKPGPVSNVVHLGSTYDNAYLVQKVWRSDCALGWGAGAAQLDPTGTLTVPCAQPGTGVNAYLGEEQPSPDVYRSDDAATSHNLFVNGTALPFNVKPTIFTLLPCNQTVTHDWEDSPWDPATSPLPQSSWNGQDFHFAIQTSCAANANIQHAPTRLVR